MTTRPAKDPAAMTAGEVNRELKKLDAEMDANCAAFIDAGRSHDTLAKVLDERRSVDPLSREAQRIHARRRLLVNEVEDECGPGMRELPQGWRRRRR